ncbi:hypothetical protein FA15DRAFT_710733 [Coprinopsis marcescibilis]|uniref:Uncharacterized protein n=1 Tax=Coprinopsis marcescibilis TaxID=230819 RepID=A0A5C3KCL0_COPMA|nr:hypothetical protein FA15DRAFT_710733 [Coprinopsis marcescibilis]
MSSTYHSLHLTASNYPNLDGDGSDAIPGFNFNHTVGSNTPPRPPSSSRYHDFPTRHPSKQDTLGPPIEDLPLEVLLRNKFIKKIFQDWQEAAAQVTKSSQITQNLYEENIRLNKEIQLLRQGGLQLPHMRYPFPHSYMYCSLILFRALSSQFAHSRTASLAPSDSISNSLSPINPDFPSSSTSFINTQPSARPRHLPFTVLWTLADCADDPDIGITSNNTSQPSMKSALREADGTMITPEKYSEIQSDVIALAGSNLTTLPDPKPTKKGANSKPPTRSMTWYKTFHRNPWNNVVSKLERRHEVLRLCGASWKAEHMLSAHLNAASATAKKKRTGSTATKKTKGRPRPCQDGSSEDAGSESEDDEHQHRAASSKLAKRPRSKSQQEEDGNHTTPKKPRGDADGEELGPQEKDNIDIKDVFGLGDPPENPPPPPPKKDMINISGIVVNPSPSLKRDFPRLANATALLDRLQHIFNHPGPNPPGTPDRKVLDFISRIETADPNSPTLSEDDKDAGWGHYQFTEVGDCATAYRLIAAALKTCRVARFVCTDRKLMDVKSYLSDMYLDLLIEQLWDLVKDIAIGGTPEKEVPNPGGGSDGVTGSELVQGLTVELLKAWISKNPAIMCSSKRPKKLELVSAVLASAHIPTAGDIQLLQSEKSTKAK